MPEVIRGDTVVSDTWHFAGVEGEADVATLPAGAVAVPLAVWTAQGAALRQRGTPLGVWLAPADAPETLFGSLEALSLVAVRFPKFTDGRGYSTAVLLRRAGFRGELRAFGDLGRDQLFYLARCGFDAFALRPGADPRAALASLADFTEPYQASVAEPRPLFRRRAAARPGALR